MTLLKQAKSVDRWDFAQSWVDKHSRIICGYVRNHYYLNYSSYEIGDFLSEAYIAAFDASGEYLKISANSLLVNRMNCFLIMM